MTDYETRPGSGELPTAGEWLTVRYGPDWTVKDVDVVVTCEECRYPAWLGDAWVEVDDARRLYTCPGVRGPEMKACGARLVRIWRVDDQTLGYSRFGDEMQLTLRSVHGTDYRIQHEF